MNQAFGVLDPLCAELQICLLSVACKSEASLSVLQALASLQPLEHELERSAGAKGRQCNFGAGPG